MRSIEEDRAITVTVASPRVPGSPHYRLMLRNGAVRAALERFRPDLIECQDAYNLPWAAIGYRKRHPETALVAAYMTDFPTVYVERPFSKVLGRLIGGTCAPDLLFLLRGPLSAVRRHVHAERERWRREASDLGIPEVDIVPLGVELGEFGPGRRDRAIAEETGPDAGPAIAGLCRPARRREEARPRRRGVPAPSRFARRQAGADRRGAAQGRHRRRSATIASRCRAIARTAPSLRGGWRVRTFTFRAWPTRRSGFRSSKPRPPGFRSSASRQGR